MEAKMQKDKFGFQRGRCTAGTCTCEDLLSWKRPMTAKFAFIPLDITSITTRIIRMNNNSSLNRAAGAHYYLIIINHKIGLPLVLPQQKDNRLLPERRFWLWWVFKSHSFSQLPSTITKNSCSKNSITTNKVFNISIHWCFFASEIGRASCRERV